MVQPRRKADDRTESGVRIRMTYLGRPACPILSKPYSHGYIIGPALRLGMI
jgi:hypothetical protein